MKSVVRSRAIEVQSSSQQVPLRVRKMVKAAVLGSLNSSSISLLSINISCGGLGEEGLLYAPFPYEQAKQAMVAKELSQDVANSLSEMDQPLSKGRGTTVRKLDFR